MRRLLLACIAALPVLLFQTEPSHAVIFACVNCAQWEEQLKSDALQVEQKIAQVATLQQNIDMYKNMLLNTAQLPQMVWSNVQSDIMQVRNLANAASLLTGNSGSILSRLQSAQGYANQATFLPQNIGQQFTLWSQTLGNASNSLGRTLGVQQGQEASAAALQAAIQAHATTATGQMQALGAANESLGLINTQLQQVHTSLTAYAQQQATRDIIAADRTRSEDAAMMNFLQAQGLSTTGGVQY